MRPRLPWSRARGSSPPPGRRCSGRGSGATLHPSTHAFQSSRIPLSGKFLEIVLADRDSGPCTQIRSSMSPILAPSLANISITSYFMGSSTSNIFGIWVLERLFLSIHFLIFSPNSLSASLIVFTLASTCIYLRSFLPDPDPFCVICVLYFCGTALWIRIWIQLGQWSRIGNGNPHPYPGPKKQILPWKKRKENGNENDCLKELDVFLGFLELE